MGKNVKFKLHEKRFVIFEETVKSMIGSTISHYTILEKIGEGGMGAVYRAEDINLKRTVALKFLPLQSLSNDKERARFIQEAQAEAALDHPNICTVYEIEEAEGRIFIAMAFVEGNSLKEAIQTGPMSVSTALDIAIQIGKGLQDAHERGIIHRDIKPANVMLNGRGQAKILDFGLAKLTDPITSTRGEHTMGTLSYMSPEQVSGGEVDHRTDIWSLGIILYEVLTGVQPFRTDKEYDAAVLYSIMHEEPEPPSRLNGDIPPDLDPIVQRAMQKNAGMRYASVADMLVDLRQALESIDATAHQSAPTGRIRTGEWKSRLRGIAISIAVGIAAVLIVLALVPSFHGDSKPVSVAVMDFINHTAFPQFSELLAKLLMTDLEQSPHIQILSKSRMGELAERNGTDFGSVPQAFALCREAHVQYLVSPHIRNTGDAFILEANVYDVEAERELFRGRAGPQGQNKIVVLIDELSSTIKEKLRGSEQWTGHPERRLSDITTTSVEAYLFYDIGQSLYAGNDPLKAIPHVERAVAIDSTFVEAYHFLAILYDYIGDRAGALRCVDRAVSLTRNRSATEVIKSSIFAHWIAGEWDEAIEYMKRYLELEPHDISMREKLGYVLSRYKNKPGEAIMAFEDIIARDPHNLSGRLASVYNYLGKAYLCCGQFEKSLTAYNRYEALCPDKPDPLNSQANALCFAGRYDESISLHQQVIQKYPTYYTGHKDLGLAYQAVGKYRKAANAFRRYIGTAPKESKPLGHILLGQLHLMNGSASEALREADAALALDSLSLEAHCLKGCIAVRILHDTKGAEDELILMEDLLGTANLLEDIHHYHYLHGLILLANHRFEEGLDVFRNEIETAPRDFSIFIRMELVHAYIEAGRPEEAMQEASHLLELNPYNGEINYLAGLCCRAMGADRDAIDHFMKAQRTWREADSDFLPLTRLISQLGKL